MLKIPLQQWFDQALKLPYLQVIPITSQIAVESRILAGMFHGDHADRLIAATARVCSATLFTRDEKILALGQTGLLSAFRV